MTKSFAGVLEGVLGQSAGALTHLELTCNCLGSDGVSHLAKVLTQCTALTFLSLAGNDLDHDGANIVARVLYSCVSVQCWRPLISSIISLDGTGRTASHECSSCVQEVKEIIDDIYCNK